jgi:hypothetical protein
MSDDCAMEETKYDTLIAPNLLAPYHDHFFNYRIDLDVDGESNEFRKAKIRPMDLSNVEIPRKSMWGVTFETVPSAMPEAMSPLTYYRSGYSSTPTITQSWIHAHTRLVHLQRLSGNGHGSGVQCLHRASTFPHGLRPQPEILCGRMRVLE